MSSSSNPNQNKHAYQYSKNIKEPGAIGISDEGTMRAFGNDISSLMSYVSVLVTGDSKASVTGQPLGNKFFVKTAGKCKDTHSGNIVPRSFYINNVPMGSERGLLPGIMDNLSSMDPGALIGAFSESKTPDCQSITMQTIDIYNKKSQETNFVTLSDIKELSPCSFGNGINPITNVKCPTSSYETSSVIPPITPTPVAIAPVATSHHRKKKRLFHKKRGFQLMNNDSTNDSDDQLYISPDMPDDIISQFYLISVGIFGVYLLHKVYTRQ
jgi:hypothetical protein